MVVAAMPIATPSYQHPMEHAMNVNRIKVYESETLPVLGCYNNGLITDVNADQPPLAVLQDICEALVPVVPAKI